MPIVVNEDDRQIPWTFQLSFQPFAEQREHENRGSRQLDVVDQDTTQLIPFPKKPNEGAEPATSIGSPKSPESFREKDTHVANSRCETRKTSKLFSRGLFELTSRRIYVSGSLTCNRPRQNSRSGRSFSLIKASC